MLLILLSLFLISLGVTYAYFTTIGNTKKEKFNLATGTMQLTFDDGNPEINGLQTLGLGESIIKKFTITNTGSLDASLSLDFNRLYNTYMDGSLTYMLEWLNPETNEYEKIVESTNVPVTDKEISHPISTEISVPANETHDETYHYNLVITFNSTEKDQASDINATFYTYFDASQPLKYRKYTLDVDLKGGEWTKSDAILPMSHNDTTSFPTPTKTGYNFNGWDIKGVGSKIEDDAFHMGIIDTKVTAIWEPIKYIITINKGDGSTSEEKEIDFDNNTITLPSREEVENLKEGYEFSGWEVTGGEYNPEDNTFTLTEPENVTATIIWTPKSYRYKINYREQNVTGSGYEIVSSIATTAPMDSEIPITISTKEGFTPIEENPTVLKITANPSNNVVNIDYKRNRYTLTINYDNGEEQIISRKYYQEEVILTEPTKTGHTFGSWSYTSGTLNGSTYTMGSSDTTLTAEWTTNDYKYIVYHEQMNVSGVGYTRVDAKTYRSHDKYGTTVNAPRETFTGYSQPALQTITIREDVKYGEDGDPVNNKATYQYPRISYDFNIDLNGGTKPTELTYKTSLRYEEEIELGTPTKVGHTFDSWSKVNGSGTLTGTKFKIGAGVASVRANYTLNNYGYTINYRKQNISDNNYTTFKSDNTKSAAYGTTVPTPVSPAEVGFGTPTISTLTIGIDETKNIINIDYPRNSYNLTINPNGGTYNGSTTINNIRYEDTRTLNTPVRTGYNFDKWEKPKGITNITMDTSYGFEYDETNKTYTSKNKGNSGSSAEISFNPVMSGEMSICYTVSSESNFDKAIFYVDGSKIKEDSGEKTNCHSLGNVTPSNVIKIQYSKDGSVDKGEDKLVFHLESNGVILDSKVSSSSEGSSVSGNTFTMGSENAYLTAKWTPITKVVTFNANGGTVSKPSKPVTYDNTYGDLPEPEYPGYKFLGWYTAQTGGTKIESTTQVKITNNQTLWARWIIDASIQVLNYLKLTAKSGTPNFAEIPSDLTVFEVKTKYTDITNVVNDATNPWAIDNINHTYTSTNKAHSSASEISFKISTSTNLYICYTISSQENWDKAHFYVNNNIKGEASGETTRCTNLGNITPADTIKVKYSKDISGSSGTDQVMFYLSDNVLNKSGDGPGVYALADDYGTSYYFRGDVKNNYVKFANYYWRIIRINGDGTVRMMYDGTQAWENGIDNSNRVAFKSTWNEIENNLNSYDSKYVGYMYGGAKGTASTSKVQAQTNETDSDIKIAVEKWYKTNIVDKGYDDRTKIADRIFCNDRSTPESNNALGYARNRTYYGAYNRFYTNKSTSVPTFKCDMNETISKTNDQFTSKDADHGNKKLEYPVGLITVDEIVAAGSGGLAKYNYQYYLNKGGLYWSFSPNQQNTQTNMFGVLHNVGLLGNRFVEENLNVAPVINLTAEYAKTLIGDGTAKNPYREAGVEP